MLTDETWRAIGVDDERVRADVGWPAADDETEASRLWHTRRVTNQVRSCLLPMDVQGFLDQRPREIEGTDDLTIRTTGDVEFVTVEQN